MHVSVLTREGEAVALTSTVNLILGSRLMDEKTGIILNDEMDDFSIPGEKNAFGLAPSPYNYIHPYKRPLSSSAPTILSKDGIVHGVIGASGGSHITSAVLTTLIRMFDFGANAYDGVHLPRFHHQLIPNHVWTEFGTPKEVIDGWRNRGHEVVVSADGVTVSGVSAIKRYPSGIMEGAGDTRKNGDALAY
jgi:gamma-glutamyltranspeptidase/glutathione hydrolase/leukotriene-C4 hydrolase